MKMTYLKEFRYSYRLWCIVEQIVQGGRNMSEQKKEEVLYLKSLVNSIKYDDMFIVKISENKEVFGMLSLKQGEESLFFKYKTLYDTLKDLDHKIKYSFIKGIDYTYNSNLYDNYDMIKTTSSLEVKAYYYIENAIFRTIILWDLLAQFYNIHYKKNIPITKLYYKSFFKDMVEDDNIDSNIKKIYNYLEENDDTSKEDRWYGNHIYVNNIRNKMTHRNSPNVTTISDFDMNFKEHPAFLLKRTIEDYYQVSMFLQYIINLVNGNG